jgi:hypothetical protein
MSTVKSRFVLAASHTWIFRAAYADGDVGHGLLSRCGPGQFGPMVTTPESRPCSAEDPPEDPPVPPTVFPSLGDVGLWQAMRTARRAAARAERWERIALL